MPRSRVEAKAASGAGPQPAAARRPLPSMNFRAVIHIGRRAVEVALTRVEFPSLAVRAAAAGPAPDVEPRLVLQRGWDADPVLLEWWQAQRADRSSRRGGRRVEIDLLEKAGGRPALRWSFTGCRPVALDHSPLDAMQPAILVERLSLTFDEVEVEAIPRGR